MTRQKISPPADRYFGPDPRQVEVAQKLYESIENLPLVCPHGHVDPSMFADPDYAFGSPTQLLLIPDHYIFRMLYSQGIALESLGLRRLDNNPVETDHRKIWQIFADHFYLFRGTPTGMWLTEELYDVFGIEDKLTSESAQAIYDQLEAKLQEPAFRPRTLFERFNIEVLCTTDAAIDPLSHHKAIRESGWSGQIRPTFRPDNVIDLNAKGWRDNINQLSDLVGIDITSYAKLVQALEDRRAFFKDMGATATDHAVFMPAVTDLSPEEVDAIFQQALAGNISPGRPGADEAAQFMGHVLMEMARMSTEDGLVMQMHIGSYRNHNPLLFEQFGPDMGADIPVQTELTRHLKPLLNRYGSHPNFKLILFNLDETNYARELAPLAGHYPSVRLGPPWWFHDSLNGLNRYFDQVMETAGIYNTAGFNDDTRAFPSIPARHNMWRRASANWVAGLTVRGIVDEFDAQEMVHDLAYGLAKKAYNL